MDKSVRKPRFQATNPCDGLALRQVLLTKSVVKRRVEWKHFGSVTPDNSFDCTTIGDDIEFEFGSEQMRKKQDMDRDLSRRQQMYFMMALDQGIAEKPCERIRDSLTPRDQYMHEVNRKAELIHKQIAAKCKLEYEREKLISSGDDDGRKAMGISQEEIDLTMKLESAKVHVDAVSTFAEKVEATMAVEKLKQELSDLQQRVGAANGHDDEERPQEEGDDLYTLFSKATSAEAREESLREKSLFVRNLPSSCTREDVEDYLYDLDPDFRASRIKVIPGGLCFIDCKTRSDADALFKAMQVYNKIGYSVIEVSRTEKKRC